MVNDQPLNTVELCGKRTRRGYNMGTASGQPFWPLDPRVEEVRLHDIAAHLARICRFNGALRDSVEHYSVAQHSVLVSWHVPVAYALEGLLHDAAEAYTGDMIKPLKSGVPGFVEIANNIDRVVRERFGLAAEESACVKAADYRAVLTERRDLLPIEFNVDWGVPRAEPWPEIIVPLGPRAAQTLFLARYAEITGEPV